MTRFCQIYTCQSRIGQPYEDSNRSQQNEVSLPVLVAPLPSEHPNQSQQNVVPNLPITLYDFCSGQVGRVLLRDEAVRAEQGGQADAARGVQDRAGRRLHREPVRQA